MYKQQATPAQRTDNNLVQSSGVALGAVSMSSLFVVSMWNQAPSPLCRMCFRTSSCASLLTTDRQNTDSIDRY